MVAVVLLLCSIWTTLAVPSDSEAVTYKWLTDDWPRESIELLGRDVHWAHHAYVALPPTEDGRGEYRMKPDWRYAAHMKLPTMGSQEWTVISMALAANVVRRNIPGDVIETGVFKGGSTIAMLHVLGLKGSTKTVHACDAFQGLPASVSQDSTGCRHALDGVPTKVGCQRGQRGAWASSRKVFDINVHFYQKRLNMSKNVNVLEGWFSDTLPRFHNEHGGREGTLSLLRLDGDVYSSTKVSLEKLYPMLSPGGLVYIDDYGSYAGCAQAVDELMRTLPVKPRLHKIWQWASRPETGAPTKVFEAIWWMKGEEVAGTSSIAESTAPGGLETAGASMAAQAAPFRLPDSASGSRSDCEAGDGPPGTQGRSTPHLHPEVVVWLFLTTTANDNRAAPRFCIPGFKVRVQVLRSRPDSTNGGRCTNEAEPMLLGVHQFYEEFGHDDVLIFAHFHKTRDLTGWHAPVPLQQQMEQLALTAESYFLKVSFGGVYCQNWNDVFTVSGLDNLGERLDLVFKGTAWEGLKPAAAPLHHRHAAGAVENKKAERQPHPTLDLRLPLPSNALHYPCCSTFFTRGASVRRFPRADYLTVVSNMISQCTTGLLSHRQTKQEQFQYSNGPAGRILEGSWHMMLGGSTKVPTPPYCLHSARSGMQDR